MDSQDIVAWGKLQPDKYISERERIKALCDWGKPFGLDGFIRMEFDLYASAIAEYIVALRLILLSQRGHDM